MVGHPCAPKEGGRAYFLQVNGQIAVDGVRLPKAQFYWATIVVDVADKGLRLTAACHINGGGDLKELCRDAHTTLMALKITKLGSEKTEAAVA